MHAKGLTRKCMTIACSFMLAWAGAISPAFAYADSSERESLQQQANTMTQKIEEATSAYQAAEAKVLSLQQMIEENEARTSEIEQLLPAQRARTAASIKALYLFQKSSQGLLGLILSSENLNEFIATLSYIDSIHERNTNEINALVQLNDELTSTKAELVFEYEAAELAQEDASSALDQARQAKRELQQRADEIAAAEEKERAEAVAAAQEVIKVADANRSAESNEASQNSDAQEQSPAQEQKVEQPAPASATFTTSSGNTAVVEVPDIEVSASTEPIVSNTTLQESSGWAARIDAYLAGSPLAGYGSTFAAAAAQYGVDPRFSPAISCVESGKGAVCFRPHNAWGWGNVSWPDWETAIYDHVAGLASGYDGTLTLEGAQRYCPPNYQEWYSSVLAEMNSI